MSFTILKKLKYHSKFISGIFSSRQPLPEASEWPLYTRDQPQYYILNADGNGLGKGPRSKACAFWNDFLQKVRTNQKIEEGCSIKLEDVTDGGTTLTSIYVALICSISTIISIIL